MKLVKIFSLIAIFLTFSAPTFGSQGSLIETVIKSRDSIVSIHALLGEAAQAQAAPLLDARTGRVVMRTKMRTAQFERSGAGVVIRPEGLIVTNIHTVQSAHKIAVILQDGTKLAAKVLHLLPKHDLALLKVEPPSPLTPIEFADSNYVQLGDEVLNIGHSQLLKETISGGRIIGLGTSTLKPGDQPSVELIRINMNLYRGDSGGPILDKDGRLIGMIVAKQTTKDKVAYAIPSNKIKKLYLDFIK